jgi:hypothetical protein
MGLIYLTLSLINTNMNGLSGSVANFHYYLAASSAYAIKR